MEKNIISTYKLLKLHMHALKNIPALMQDANKIFAKCILASILFYCMTQISSYLRVHMSRNVCRGLIIANYTLVYAIMNLHLNWVTISQPWLACQWTKAHRRARGGSTSTQWLISTMDWPIFMIPTLPHTQT